MPNSASSVDPDVEQMAEASELDLLDPSAPKIRCVQVEAVLERDPPPSPVRLGKVAVSPA
jgi:hypothetical protein